jgi:predicted dehydrogenase
MAGQAGAEIIAVADAAAGAAAKAAEKWSIANAYDSVEAMLAGSPELDAVSIIVPNKFHAPLAIQCLNAGKHVFCEKPPALSAAQVAHTVREGAIRLSPHCYNTVAEIERVLEILDN